MRLTSILDEFHFSETLQLNENYTPREAECFLIGCNIALRAEDLLSIKFSDCNGTHIDMSERKTGKFRKIPITQTVRDAIRRLKEYYERTKFYVTKKDFKADHLFSVYLSSFLPRK